MTVSKVVIATNDEVVSEHVFDTLSDAMAYADDFGVLEAMAVAYKGRAKSVVCVVFDADTAVRVHGFLAHWHSENGMEWLDIAQPFDEISWTAE